MVKRVLLASPRGYCAGVERAVETVERALALYGSPVYVRKQIVHNSHVVRDLEARGAVFVDELSSVPEGANVVFSAHGIAPAVRTEAERARARDDRRDVPARDEGAHAGAALRARPATRSSSSATPGTRRSRERSARRPTRSSSSSRRRMRSTCRCPADRPLAYVTQTTLSVDETSEIVAVLRRRFPHIEEPAREDICYATSNRQWAVKELLDEVDLLLVVGSENSSNSVRLVDVARAAGVDAYLVDDVGAIDESLARRARDGRADVGSVGARAPRRGRVRVVRRARRGRERARADARGRELQAAGRAAPRRARGGLALLGRELAA